MLRTSRRCFVCLKIGHLSRDCRSSGKCSKCRGRHHTSICFKGKGQSDSKQLTHQQHESISTADNSSRLNPSAPTFNSGNTSTMLIDSKQTTLLQTACALVFNPRAPSKQAELRFILDTGSQKSYITESATRELSLKGQGERAMTIMTFGSTVQKRQLCKEVKLGVQTKGGAVLELILFTVPFISESLDVIPSQFVTERYSHLRGLDLADSSTVRCQREPDILIGADQYWDISHRRDSTWYRWASSIIF